MKYSAVRIPLAGWVAQIWVQAYAQWFTVIGCPIFDSPDSAINWAKENQ